MINSCGASEGDQEFVVLTTSADVDPALINVIYSTTPGCAVTAEVYTPAVAQSEPPGFINTLNTLAGCVAFQAATNPIPAGSTVIVFDVDLVANSYTGWNAFCGQTIYILFTNLPMPSGNFVNSANTRYFCVSYNGGPSSVYGYTNTTSTVDGTTATWGAPGTVNSDIPAMPNCGFGGICTPPIFTNPGNQNLCSSYTLPPITGSNVSASAMYYSGPNGTGTSYSPGDMVGAGTYYIYDLSSGCSDQESFTVTVTPPPTANTAGPLSACGNAAGEATFNLTLSNNAINGGSGQPVNWYEDMVATMLIGSPAAYTTGTTTVYAVVGTAPCTSNPVAVQINVNTVTANPPSTPILICYTTTPPFVNVAEITALFNQITSEITGGAAGATVNWWFNSNGTSPINFFSLANLITLASGPQPTTVYANMTLGGCTSATVPVTSTVALQPTANPAGPLSACDQGGGQATFNLSSLDGAVGGTVNWYSDMATTQPIANPGAYVSGSGTVYATTTNANGCESGPRAVTLTVTPAPDAGNDGTVSVCNNGQTVNLVAALGGTPDAGGAWTDDGGSGVSLGNPSSVSFNGVSGGSFPFTYTVSGGSGCPSASATVTVTVTEAPDANPAGPFQECGNPAGQVTFDLSLFDNAVNGGSGEPVSWFQNMAGTIPVPNPNAFTTTSTTVYAVVGTAPCTSAPIAVQLITDPSPSTNPAGPLELCDEGGGQAAFNLSTLNNTVSGGSGTVIWYSDPAAMIPIPNPTNYNTASTTVYAVLTLNSCPSSPLAVTLTVNPAPTASPAGPLEVCSNGPQATFDLLSLNGTISGGSGTVSWFTNAAATIAVPNPAAFTSASTTVYAVLSEGGCDSAPLPVMLDVVAGPNINPISDVSVCNDFTLPAITGSNLTGGQAYYTQPSGGGSVFQPGDLINTTITLYAYDGTPGCDDQQAFSITIGGAPIAQDAELSGCGEPSQGGAATYDLGEAEAVVNGGSGLPVLWFLDAGATQPIANPAAFVSAGGMVYAVVDGGPGCQSAPATVMLLLSSEPSPLDLSASATQICGPDDITLTFSLPNGGASYSIELQIAGASGTQVQTYNGLTNLSELVFTLSEATTFTITQITNDDTGCTFVLNPAPDLSIGFGSLLATPATLETCDNGSGQATFNLTSLNATILNGQTGTVTYYLDATTNTPIANPASYTSAGGTVFATISNGLCESASVPVTLSLNAAPTLTLTPSQPSCASVLDGSLNLVVSGAGGFSFDWSSNALDGIQNPTNLGAGIYSVTVTDANNCTASASATLSDPPVLNLSCAQLNPVSSPGANDGAASLTITGGTAPYNIVYTGPQNGSTTANTAGTTNLSNLMAGAYNVIITDDNGCSETCNFAIGSPSCNLSINVSGVISPCFGAVNGILQVDVMNGTGMLTFDWNVDSLDGQQNPSLLPAGTYSVTVTDEAGCSANGSVSLVTPPAMTIVATVISPASGPAAMDGSVEIIFGNGVAPYTILLLAERQNFDTIFTATYPMADTININNLAPGYYSVELSDDNYCRTGTAFTICGDLVLTIHEQDVSCPGNSDGSAYVVASGGNGTLSYTWDNSVLNDSISNLAVGPYIVTVTDLLGCSAVDTANIGAPLALMLACAQQSAPSAPAAADASATLTITGGTAPYSLSYTGPSSGNQNGIATAGSFNVTGLSAGDYTFSITDANGCTTSCQLTITATLCNLTVSLSGINPTCDGEATGSIDVTSSGGSGMLQFDWNVDSLDNIKNPSGLLAGIYSVTVSDVAGCQAIATDTLTAPPALTLSCGQSSPASGPGVADGAALIAFGGGTAPYTLAFTGPANFTLTANTPSSPVIPGLLPGNYDLVITDANGCMINCAFTISDNSCPLTLNISGQAESCAGALDGSVSVTAMGAPPYNYTWSPAGVGPMLSGLAPGNYVVTVTDNNSCQATANFIVAAGAPLPGLTAGAGGSICADACFDLSVNLTGTPPFSLSYQVQNATDTLSFTESFTQNSGQIQVCPTTYSFAPGSFQLVFLSLQAGACTTSFNGLNTNFVLQGPAMTTLNPTLCPGESITVNGNIYQEGTPNGTETLVGAAANGCDSIVQIQLSFYPPSIFNLNSDLCEGDTVRVGNEIFDAFRPTGTVVLTAAAASGCDSTVVVNLNVLPLSTTLITTTLCPGATLVAAGQTFSQAMPSGEIRLMGAAANGCDSIVKVNLSFFPAAVGNLTESLCPGDSRTVGTTLFNESNPTGSVTLTGASVNGCDSVVQVMLSYLPASTSTIAPTLCPGESVVVGTQTFDAATPTGTVVLTNSAGCDSTITVNLSFYSPASGTYQATLCPDETFSLGGQTFDVNQPDGQVMLTSSTGCDSLVTVDLTFNPAAVGNLDQSLCAGESLTLGGQTFNAANPQGVVILQQASAFGCDSTVIVNLSFAPALSASLSGSDEICNGQSATLVLDINGAAAFDLSYSNGTQPPVLITGAVDGQTIVVSPTATTTYTLTQATAQGISCPVSLSGSALIRVSNLSLNASVTSNYDGFGVSCPEAADGAALAVVASGLAPYQFSWSNGATSAQASGLMANQVYQVFVTDAAGCRDTAQLSLSAPLPITASAMGVSPSCFGNGNGAILISSIQGGGGSFEYSLDGQFFFALGPLPATIPDLAAGAYILSIQDDNDCRTTLNVAVAPAQELILDLGPDLTISLGDSIRLDALTNFTAASWTWTPTTQMSRPDSLSTYVSPLETTIYQITALDANGCDASDWIRITVDETVPIYIPSAFSPDEDGTNDILYIFAGPGVSEVKRFQIYDRWGNQLFVDGPFQPNDPTHGWNGNFNGSPMNSAVYVYYAEVLLTTGKVVLLKGDVTLLR